MKAVKFMINYDISYVFVAMSADISVRPTNA